MPEIIPSGIIAVDKDAGMSSHDVINKLRRILNTRRVGHAGTLDEMATGVLPVCFGRATRAVEYAQAAEKTYVATLKLGLTSDTQDIWGKIIRTSPSSVGARQLKDALLNFTGEQLQLPPMYSALKRNGMKLYELARKGIEVEREARSIRIDNISLLEANETAQEFVIEVDCSKGVYIRSLCSDIGDFLVTGGVMAALRRTRNGLFRIENCFTLSKIAELAENDRLSECVLPVDVLFFNLPRRVLSEKQEFMVRNGASFPTDDMEGRVRAYSEDGEFIALCEVAEGEFRLIKSFYETGDKS